MRFKKYAELTRLTASPEEFINNNTNKTLGWSDLLHGVLGIVSDTKELGEAIEMKSGKNISEEAGDCFWFIACCSYGLAKSMGGAHTYDAVFEDIIESSLNYVLKNPNINKYKDVNSLFRDLLYAAADLADQVKATMAYGKAEHEKRCLDSLKKYTTALIALLDKVRQGSQKSLPDVISDLLTWNLVKLQKRFGDKFSPEAREIINKENELSHMSAISDSSLLFM
jgi:hypothetical protein